MEEIAALEERALEERAPIQLQQIEDLVDDRRASLWGDWGVRTEEPRPQQLEGGEIFSA